MTAPTVVTGLFDPAETEPASARPPLIDYIERGELPLGLEANLICFVEPSSERQVREARDRAGLRDQTVVVPHARESLVSARLLEQVAAARRTHPLLNGDPVKDTPLQVGLSWARFELLLEAIAANPFGSDHYIWVDSGIARSAKTEHYLADRVFADTPDAVRILQMAPLDAFVLHDRAHHFSYQRGHFAPALISGRASRLRDLCVTTREVRDEALSEGLVALDEHLLEIAVARRAELFSFHHGAFDHILENYRRPRGSADNLLSQLRSWRWAQNWQPAAELAARIVDSVTAGTFVSTPAHLAGLLEECYLISYYAESGERTLARTCAALYAERAHSDPEFREEFLRHEVRVRTNLGYVGQTV